MNFYNSPFGNQPPRGILDIIKAHFKHGTALTRLIYINIGVYLLVKIFIILALLGGIKINIEDYAVYLLGVPANIQDLLMRPWTIITYMFTQVGFFHLLFNMLWLQWFGSMFLANFSNRKLVSLYILGGISGAALYLLAFNILPSFIPLKELSVSIGASGAVMAVVFAVCFYEPQRQIYLFLFGSVKLIHLALFTVLLDILSIPSGNAGGHIAHIGGAVFGFLFAIGLKYGWFNLKFKRKPKMSFHRNASNMTDGEYNSAKRNEDDRVDEILDKISRSGYESLTREEKQILFKSGRG